MDWGWYTAPAMASWVVGLGGVAASVYMHRRIDRVTGA
jgi:hypothetical protein